MATNQRTWSDITADQYAVLRAQWRSKGITPPYANKGLLRGHAHVLANVEFDELAKTLNIRVRDAGDLGYERFFEGMNQDIGKRGL